MISDKFNNVIYQSKDIAELIYKNYLEIDSILVESSPEIEEFEKSSNLTFQRVDDKLYDLSVPDFDKLCQSNWFIPETYQTIDVEHWVLSQCSTDIERARINEELAAFKEKNMIMLLRTLKYLVDTLRNNKIVWGVGRGSSVASYVLYKIGVHKIDSIKYDLDWREFLR